MALLKDEQRMHWYVMRDLKRPNAKLPAYKQLSDAGPAFYPRYKRSSRYVCS